MIQQNFAAGWTKFAALFFLLGVLAQGAPAISRVDPGFGAPGARISLTGSDFSQVQRVLFGEVPSDFVVSSSGLILATIPAGGVTGVIRLEAANGNTATKGDFVVAPRIDKLRPARGAAGSIITVEGANFLDVAQVFLGIREIDFEVTSPGQLAVLIPDDATNSAPIVVLGLAGFDLSSHSFVITGPEPIVDAFEPAAGAPGSAVKVTGANFEGVSAVRFGTTLARFSVTSSDQLQVVVPTNAFSSRIAVSSRFGTGGSAQSFSITRSPVITNFSPTIGKSGTQVMIEGINFTDITGIGFNGKPVAGIGSGALGQIQVAVPEGATSGLISVTNRSGLGVSPGPFTITSAPVITGFEPPFGQAGSSIRVEGMNFLTIPRSGGVKMGGLPVAYSVTADNQLQFTVPGAATNGFLIVSNLFGSTTSAIPFQVTTKVPFVTSAAPLSGPRGTKVRIEGDNFSNVTGVYFNGLLTREIEQTAANQMVVTVPPGVTSGLIVLSNTAGVSTNIWRYDAPPQLSGFFPQALNAGSTLSIRGTNFSNVSSVKLGIVEVPFSLINEGELRVVMPTNVVKGLVRVQSQGGVILSTGSVAILPAIYDFSPKTGPPNTVIRVVGSGFDQVQEVSIGGVGAQFSVGGLDQLAVLIPSGVSVGTLRVKTADGLVESSEPFQVTGVTDLSVTAFASPVTSEPGDIVTWNVTVRNLGPLATTKIGVTNSFAPGLRIREVIAPFGTIITNGNQVDFQFDLLTNNQAVVIQYKSQSTASALYTNVIRVGSAQFDPDLSNNLILTTARVAGEKDRTLSGFLTPGEKRLVVSWPATALPLSLETTSDLVPPLLWLPLTNGIVRLDGKFVFTNLSQGRERYFRLVLP